MSKRIISIKHNRDAFQLTWILNNICTNHCDYCPPILHSGTNHHYDWSIAKEFLHRLFDRYPLIHCSISGGEPTLSPFFPELVKMFYDRGHTVGITSNGARTVRYWEEISPMLNYVCFSYHPSFEDPNFFEKALTAAKYTSSAVRVMMDTRYWDKSVSMFERCQDSILGAEPVKIIPETAMKKGVGEDYTPEQLEWIATRPLKFSSAPDKQNNPNWSPANINARFFYSDGSVDKIGESNQLIINGQTDFRGWSCNIGLESLFVHWDGYVKKGNCMQGGELFHLNDHAKHELPTSGEICLQNLCSCGTDVLITKAAMLDKNHPYVTNNQRIRPVFNDEQYKQAFYDSNNQVRGAKVIRIVKDE